MENRPAKWKHRLVAIAIVLLLLYGLALIPNAPPERITPGGNPSFAWDRDELWNRLEAAFLKIRQQPKDKWAPEWTSMLAEAHTLLKRLESERFQPKDPIFDQLESLIFALGPYAAASAGFIPEYHRLIEDVRRTVKAQSRDWDLSRSQAKRCLYQLLQGGRMALEEAFLQHPLDLTDHEPIAGSIVRSSSPSATIRGVHVHSGDLLLSRGTAPTSALIARGNDYPGGFSHVALLHIHEQSKEVSVIESHIEGGVAIASVDEYMADKKFRILVLRLSDDLPILRGNPLLPHEAATKMLDRAKAESIPYDFAMDFSDPEKLFCSEVASAAYGSLGFELWMNLSSISNPTLATWLNDFGVQHFRTQAPSDLEYDPQLIVVHEWRKLEGLKNDHLDNAVVDAMLEEAQPGQHIEFNIWLLPIVRLVKAYSAVLNLWGAIGPIPEGMNSTAALRNNAFSARHLAIKEQTLELIEEHERNRGYYPPYWTQVELARRVIRDYRTD